MLRRRLDVRQDGVCVLILRQGLETLRRRPRHEQDRSPRRPPHVRSGKAADLVRHGADVNEVVGATPLHMAVDVVHRGIEGHPQRARRRLKCLKELLRLGADPNIPASDGTTPLHTALKKEYFDAFEILVQHGANPDLPGKDGRTVREIASKKRDARYFKALS